MRMKTVIVSALTGSLALGPVVGCSNLPGNEKEQGAVIGGAGGALAGAALAGKDDRLIGALIGGALGAGRQTIDADVAGSGEARQRGLPELVRVRQRRGIEIECIEPDLAGRPVSRPFHRRSNGRIGEEFSRFQRLLTASLPRFLFPRHPASPRHGLQPVVTDGLAAFFAEAVAAVFHSFQGRLDLVE